MAVTGRSVSHSSPDVRHTVCTALSSSPSFFVASRQASHTFSLMLLSLAFAGAAGAVSPLRELPRFLCGGLIGVFGR
ncbi:hypothetical protein EB73_34070 [Mycobacterium sp. SWH-M3]|nr:hypothetical protein EB73_34070 [Mycobacterium sp. SWH-M3]